LRDAIAQAIVDIMYAQGWTCDYHEPDVRCSECKKAWKRTADAVMGLLAEQPTIEVYVQSASEGTWAELGFGHGNEVSHRAIKAELGAGGGGRYALVRLP